MAVSKIICYDEDLQIPIWENIIKQRTHLEMLISYYSPQLSQMAFILIVEARNTLDYLITGPALSPNKFIEIYERGNAYVREALEIEVNNITFTYFFPFSNFNYLLNQILLQKEEYEKRRAK